MYTDILILSRLANRPAHGYEIKKHVDRFTRPRTINNNVLYPALRRFEADGVIERVSHESEAGRPPRTVYRLTDNGFDMLAAMLRDTDPEVLKDQAEFQIRLGFFGQLQPDERAAILVVRRAEVAAEISLHESLRPEAADHLWGLEIIDFNLGQMRAELSWLDRLDQIAVEAGQAGDD